MYMEKIVRPTGKTAESTDRQLVTIPVKDVVTAVTIALLSIPSAANNNGIKRPSLF